MFVVSIVVFGLYLFYCLSQFKECTYSIRVDTAELKKCRGLPVGIFWEQQQES